MTREEKVARARELRGQGLKLREVAAEMGYGLSTVHAWLSDPDRSKEIARKRSYGGTCIDCGATTSGSNGPGLAPDRCSTCQHRFEHETREWTQQTVVAAIQRFAERYGRPPNAADFLAGAGVKPKHRERYYGDGDYPTHSTITRECGSLNAAVELAGFTPTAPGRYALTARIGDEPDHPVVQEAIRLYRDEGLSAARTAERLGVSGMGVLYWLKRAGVERRPPINVRQFSDSDLVAALLRMGHEKGRTPMYRDFDHHSPCGSVIVKRFASWNAALEAAGFEPRHSTRRKAVAA